MPAFHTAPKVTHSGLGLALDSADRPSARRAYHYRRATDSCGDAEIDVEFRGRYPRGITEIISRRVHALSLTKREEGKLAL